MGISSVDLERLRAAAAAAAADADAADDVVSGAVSWEWSSVLTMLLALLLGLGMVVELALDDDGLVDGWLSVEPRIEPLSGRLCRLDCRMFWMACVELAEVIDIENVFGRVSVA